jgi:hypothetical protein
MQLMTTSPESVVLTLAKSALASAKSNLESLRDEAAPLSRIGTAERRVRDCEAALEIAVRDEPRRQEAKQAEEDRQAAHEATVKESVRRRYQLEHPECSNESFDRLFPDIRAQYAEADLIAAKERVRPAYPRSI